MAFINGFPTEDDRKTALYALEPEQLSDLVAVPQDIESYTNFKLITYNEKPETKSDYDIQKVSFPFSSSNYLFQRYNPYGRPFADEYSKKLYDFLFEYSYLDLIGKSSLLHMPVPDQTKEAEFESFDIGKPLKVTLPNNGLRITFSYYYPEINPNGILIGSSFRDYKYLDAENAYLWRTALTPRGNKPKDRDGAYHFNRIDNDCYKSPGSRKWLLRFETRFCLGQEIEIDEDILVSSLVMDLDLLSQSEQEGITNQIPECYFYHYLDAFFSRVKEVMLRSNPEINNPKIATAIKHTFKVNYGIKHYIKNFEEIYGCASSSNPLYGGDETCFRYHLAEGTQYGIFAQYINKDDSEIIEYTKLPDCFKFGALIYANNNNWDNYEFELLDAGTEIEFRSPSYYSNGQNSNYKLEAGFIFYGNRLGDRSNESHRFNKLIRQGISHQFPYGASFIDEYHNPDQIIYDPQKQTTPYRSRNLFYDELRQSVPGQKNFPASDYWTRLFYSSANNIPYCFFRIGNNLTNQAYIVTEEIGRQSINFLRGNSSKEFFVSRYLYTYDINYDHSETKNYYSFINVSSSPSITRKSLGSVDTSFTKYGADHPVAMEWKRYEDDSIQGGYYEPRKYFKGVHAPSNFVPGTYTNGVPMPGEDNQGGIDLFKLGNFPIDPAIEFNTTGTLTASYTSTFVPAQRVKGNPKYEFSSLFLDLLEDAHQRCYMSGCDLEDLKKWVQEIHLALGAGKYAYREGSTEISRDWNLGEQIEAQSTVLGLSFNSDYSIRSIRQAKLIEKGDSISSGWNFGQFGKNTGGSSTGQEGGKANEKRFGIAYEIHTNTFENNNFTGEDNSIKQGGVVLCENYPQLFHFIIQDFGRGLGLQDMGANVLPTPNGEIASYIGLNQMILDALFTLGQISQQISSINVVSLKNQAVLQEVMTGIGLPVTIKELKIAANDSQEGKLPFPGYPLNAPTLVDLFGLSLLNTGSMIGSKIVLNVSTDDENGNDGDEENS